jgi:hypothetical protein
LHFGRGGTFSCPDCGQGGVEGARHHKENMGTAELVGTRPINYAILYVASLAFALVLLLVVQNNTMKFHKAQLFQFVMLQIAAYSILKRSSQHKDP